MDDVDAAEALQAKNMLLSGDWVTQRLNGTLYLDKAPLKYWITAVFYSVFGIHDWVARLPTALAAILLCWLVTRIAGFYSGLVLATSIGLFLFTRTVIPDVVLTLLITVCLWCFMRLLEQRSIGWAMGMYTAMALAILTKGLIGVLFPAATIVVYLLISRRWNLWRNLCPVTGTLLFLAIAAPWHVIASIHNPPAFDFTLHSETHQYRGFFWFYFVNEQLLRFLNERWPRDYNTVPRLWFWLYHVIWFFPWIFYLPAIHRVKFKPIHVLAVCWIAVVMFFFTFSTTQEYYSMPIYPAVAILLGSAMTTDSKWLVLGSKTAGITALCVAGLIAIILALVWALPASGDIYSALARHANLYTLSLGHMADLTLPAFAYLRWPLEVAGASFLLGGVSVLLLKQKPGYLAVALMLTGFFQAARFALVVFDPYLSSHAIAEKLNQLPKGIVIVCGKYNPLSSVFFYSRDEAFQNDGDLDILEYGSLAPGARKIILSDPEMQRLWNGPGTVYVIAKTPKLSHVEEVLSPDSSELILRSADKYLFANRHVR